MNTVQPEHTYPDLAGKRILITGTSSGIGAGMARYLAQQGCKLVLHYARNPAGMKKTEQTVASITNEWVTLRCDFRQPDTIHPFFDQAWQAFDGLDGLVNNAGIVPKTLMTDDTDGKVFNETLAVNLQAPYLLSVAFAKRHIANQTSGNIVQNTSIHGQATCEYFSAYGASKAALDNAMRVMASEWGAFGIRVNSLAPGVVPVERTETLLSQPDMMADWHRLIPLQRFGTTEEMAQATAFLLSNASQWMTGSVLTIDGGMIARGNYIKRNPNKL